MTDRIFAYTVILEKEIREDDAEAITNAICMIKGVADITPQVTNLTTRWALERARHELRERLWQALYNNDDEIKVAIKEYLGIGRE